MSHEDDGAALNGQEAEICEDEYQWFVLFQGKLNLMRVLVALSTVLGILIFFAGSLCSCGSNAAAAPRSANVRWNARQAEIDAALRQSQSSDKAADFAPAAADVSSP